MTNDVLWLNIFVINAFWISNDYEEWNCQMFSYCFSLQGTTKQGNAESLTIPIPPRRVNKLRLVFKPVSSDLVVVKGLEIEVCLEKPGKAC